MVYLFTTDLKQFDWFGWGDLIYVLAAVSGLAQSFFIYNDNITDDDNNVFYLYGKAINLSIV